ncbi:sol-2, partial [Pristionchus pacificus]
STFLNGLFSSLLFFSSYPSNSITPPFLPSFLPSMSSFFTSMFILFLSYIPLSSSCGESIEMINDGVGSISSPPLNRSLRCEWNIDTNDNHTISIEWSHFDLSPNSQTSHQCLHSYVQLIWRDRWGRLYPSSRLCGNTLPMTMKTLQQHLTIILVSHTTRLNHSGFKLQYNIQKEENIRPVSDCYQEWRGVSGRIVSPGWPQSFLPNTTCEWLIRVERSQKILIQPLYVHMTSLEECERAHLVIMDGYKFDTSFHPNQNQNGDMAQFCGSALSNQGESQLSYISTSNRIIIKFHSNEWPLSSGERFGFKVSWTAIERINEGEVLSCPSLTCRSPVCIEYTQGACSKSTLCINSSVSCDGYSDCPFSDFSDENGCGWREMATLSIISSSILSLILILFICTEKQRRARKAIQMANSFS